MQEDRLGFFVKSVYNLLRREFQKFAEALKLREMYSQSDFSS